MHSDTSKIRPPGDPISDERLRDHLTAQAASCERDGSALYAGLLRVVAEDLDSGGVVAELMRDWQGHPTLDAVSMRLLGAVHSLVLSGALPELARHYPTVGGDPGWPAAGRLFLEALAQHFDFVRARLDQQVQTNEVRRSAALLGGFLHVAAATKQPLELLEIGASAGLNQFVDLHGYELGPHHFGPDDPALSLRADWTGAAPRTDARLEVVARSGCDIAPVDLESDEARCRLEGFIWGDQPERLQRLRSAVALAREVGVDIEQARASDWLAERLARPAAGRARVVFHSVVWWYIPKAERQAITTLIEDAGEQADADRPLAWLRMEGHQLETAELRVRLWPGGEDVHLGDVRYHGQGVHWHA